MKKEAIGFLTACVMGAGLFGGTTAWAGSDPQFFLDRLVEVRGCPPREDNFTDETRRESKLALLAGRSLKSKAKTLKASAGLSPRPGQKLWVFYDSVCRGSVVVKGFQAKKVGGKVPVLAWFDFKKSSLPVSINGNGHWMDRAVYLEAENSDAAPATEGTTAPKVIPEYSSQLLFTNMLLGLTDPPPNWQIKRWMTEWNYGRSFRDPAMGIDWLVLRYKYPTEGTNQSVLCRAGNQLGVWDRLTKNSLKQAFCWRGKTYVVLDQTGHGITWTDLFRLDPGKLIWISGHCLTEDPALDAEKPEFLFQQNNKAYLAD